MKTYIVIALFFFFSHFGYGQLYTFKTFNHKDGLFSACVSSLAEEKDGHVIIGTDGAGMLKFDGKSFKQISFQNEKSQFYVSSIFISPKNEIYFSSLYTGFFKVGKKGFERLNIAGSNGEFIGIQKFKENFIFVRAQNIEVGKEFGEKRSLKFAENTSVSKVNFCYTNNGVFIFTNVGNFYTDGKKILPLSTYLSMSAVETNKFSWSYTENNEIHFLDSNLKFDYLFTNSNTPGYKDRVKTDIPISAKISSAYSRNNKHFFVFDDGSNVILSNGKFKLIAQNTDKIVLSSMSCLIDRNGDFLNGTETKGLLKISLEPFTKLALHPLYSETNIGLPFRASDGTVVLSTFDDKTHIANIYKKTPFESQVLRINTTTKFLGRDIFGTKTGLSRLQNGKLLPYNLVPVFEDKNIGLLYSYNNWLFIGVKGEGLYAYNDLDKTVIHFNSDINGLPDYFNCAQLNEQQNRIYFGTNFGVYELNLTIMSISNIYQKFEHVGTSVGVSTIDCYQNIWFGAEHGLFGISRDGEFITHTSSKYFPSTLFYTMNCDIYGNLYLGTNVGINVVKLNKRGDIVRQKNYSGAEGFKGYETNMRSQFQNGNTILVGTVEGLFSINPELLNKFPEPSQPSVEIQLQNTNVSKNGIAFQFGLINPKSELVYYRYRIANEGSVWSKPSLQSLVNINNLSGGSYNLEVQASYDEVRFSQSTITNFDVVVPFWKKPWFILLAVLAVIGLNYYFITYKRKENIADIFSQDDTEGVFKGSEYAFGLSGVFLAGSYTLAPFADPSISSFFASSIVLSILAIIGGLIIHFSGNERIKQLVTRIVFMLILLFEFYACYGGELHPFFVVSTILTACFMPVVFHKPKSVLIVSSLMVLLSILIIIFLENAIFNRLLYFVSILTLGGIFVYISLVRSNFTSRFTFTSGVINKGNTMVISLDAENIIQFISENTLINFNSKDDKLIGMPVSILNNYLAPLTTYTNINVAKEFRDGLTFKTPLTNNKGEIRWWEWSCKEFNNNTRVLLGNDFTEKFELENSFETLIESADDFIFQCDVNGFFLFVNKKVEDVIGYSRKELERKDSMHFVHPDYKVQVMRFYREHFENKKSQSYFEFPLVTKAGKLVWLGQNLTTLFMPGSKHQVKGFLALGRDITEQRDREAVILDQNSSITDSINYASRIQTNLLPRNSYLQTVFKDFFVFSRAKDIVSGDFHWVEVINGKTIIVCADCTGHGVPGSFMTLLGINLLNTIVKENNITNPSKILDVLDKKLDEVLPRDGKNRLNDGMETSICVFENDTLHFASAGGRILIEENNILGIHRGNTKHIGDIYDNFEGYQTLEFKIEKDTSIYLFSDGFQDQFGGDKDKKYSTKKLISLLQANMDEPMRKQGKLVQEEYDRWKKDRTQTDDITVIGIKNPLH